MLRYLSLLPLALLAAGCGPGSLSVSGKVTYKGQPVQEGSIAFEAPDGSTPSVGGRIENGAYLVTGVPASAGGKKVVRISAVRKTGQKIPAGPPHPPDMMIDEIEKIPSRFNEQSTLSVELLPGKVNVHDFILADDSPR